MTTIAKKIPSPKHKHWLLGDFAPMLTEPLEYLVALQKKHGDFIQLKAPFNQLYIAYDAEIVKYILQENNKNYIKGDIVNVTRPLIGNGLVASEGDFWRKQRRLIQPAFNKEKYANIIKVIIEQTQLMLNQWEIQYTEGDSINISQEMNKLALKIVTKALFKVDMDSEIPTIKKSLSYVLGRVFKRFNNPIWYARWLPTLANFQERQRIKDIERIFWRIVSAKRAGILPYNDDILDTLLEAEDADTGEKMSDKQIRDELMTIIIAGHETTANGMAFMWHILSKKTEILQKIRDEVKPILFDIIETQNLETFKKLSYVRQVVQETLRLYPPAALIQRKNIEEDSFKGYQIPAGSNILLPIFAIHRMENYWQQPTEFIPERFNAEEIAQKPKFAYFPFGGGQRLCIGDQFALYEMMIVLMMVQNRFYFKTLTENEELTLEIALALRPKNDVFLRIFKNK